MLINVKFRGSEYSCDLSQGLDISLPLAPHGPRCFHAPPPQIEPVRSGDFTGSIEAGASVNFFQVHFNPHGNGTHTECHGHIRREHYKLKDCLKEFHFIAKVISITPEINQEGDHIIGPSQLEKLELDDVRALVIRTLPNQELKQRINYSDTNPPYLHQDSVNYMKEMGIEHLLIDLPSVDREEDGGALLSHNAFWSEGRECCTITEMVFIPNEIPDGHYLLNLQITALELDASPSNPTLYTLNPLRS